MLHISDNAAKLIRKMTAKNGIPEGGLRIAIKAGGCSGLSYSFAWEAEPREGDHVFQGGEGSKVFVDPRSFRFLDGTTLDYDTALLTQGFVFHNPNAKQTCGCGSSFGA
jgi:iron-sulfur cluster assembly protein